MTFKAGSRAAPPLIPTAALSAIIAPQTHTRTHTHTHSQACARAHTHTHMHDRIPRLWLSCVPSKLATFLCQLLSSPSRCDQQQPLRGFHAPCAPAVHKSQSTPSLPAVARAQSGLGSSRSQLTIDCIIPTRFVLAGDARCCAATRFPSTLPGARLRPSHGVHTTALAARAGGRRRRKREQRIKGQKGHRATHYFVLCTLLQRVCPSFPPLPLSLSPPLPRASGPEPAERCTAFSTRRWWRSCCSSPAARPWWSSWPTSSTSTRHTVCCCPGPAAVFPLYCWRFPV